MFVFGFTLGVVALALLPSQAHAYLDPGTGSMLLQGIIAAIAGGLAAIKIFWARIFSTVSRLVGRGDGGGGTPSK